MTTPRKISRRRMLAQSSAAAIGLIGAPNILRAKSPNSRLNIAFIGTGGRGGHNLQQIMAAGTDDVVALCDVNSRNLDAAAAKYPKARKYRDFRKMYEDSKDIDAVVVSTTEHTHALATLPALQMKKPVYCEKPLTQNVVEARIIADAAKKAGVATQMGTQIHASVNYRRVVDLIQSGAIGPVTEAHVWVSRAWGLQSAEAAKRNKDIFFVTERPTESMLVPDYLDWDLWLGPAAYRPFHEVYFPGPKWYRWWDFGNGTMSDLGSHWNDLPFWALKLDAPKTIEASGPPPHKEIAPATMSAVYEYGPRGELPACKLAWYQGELKPTLWTEKKIPQWDNGVLFIGSKGMLLADYSKYVLLPETEFKDFAHPKKPDADLPNHHQEWLAACKNGTPTGSPFSYAGPLSEANHLGNVAFRAGKKLEWDSANMKIVNYPDAEWLLTREARSGWELG